MVDVRGSQAPMQPQLSGRQRPAGLRRRKEDRSHGKRLRDLLSRHEHGTWKVSPREPVAVLRESSLGRVSELIPLRYGRMLQSRLAFLRGAPLIMARDLA